jgi:hypothetical protein
VNEDQLPYTQFKLVEHVRHQHLVIVEAELVQLRKRVLRSCQPGDRCRVKISLTRVGTSERAFSLSCFPL